MISSVQRVRSTTMEVVVRNKEEEKVNRFDGTEALKFNEQRQIRTSKDRLQEEFH